LAEQSGSGLQSFLYSSILKVEMGLSVGKYSMESIEIYGGLRTGSLDRFDVKEGLSLFHRE
jgi:hypothetical protein